MRSIQRYRLILAATILVVVPVSWLSAQDEPAVATEEPAVVKREPAAAAEEPAVAAEEPAVATEESAEASPGVVEQAAPQRAFDEVFTAWKQILSELRDLQLQFDVAEEAELAAIRQQFEATLARGRAMLPELRGSAMAAFAKSPNSDRNLTRFLLKLASDDIRADNYEAAGEITQVLLDGECDDKKALDLAGIVAFATNDFEAAEQRFNEAASAGVLSTAGQRYRPEVSKYKEYWTKERELREQEAQADDLPRVKLQTTQGDITIELFENEAPETVGNFVNLAEKGFYDGVNFHRVLQGFMAQGGCPKGDGSGGPGYKIYCECHRDDHRKHFRGSVSMAHAGRDTGGSQFFLTFVPTPHLNARHTAFGRVVEGMDVLSKLQRIDPSKAAEAAQTVPDKIIKAEVIRKRDHKYVPNKVT